MNTVREVIVYFVFTLLFVACFEDELTDNSLRYLKEENDFIIESDGSEVLFIINDCGYNELKAIEKNGQKVEVVKTFNSLMKLPCVLKTDTISLGNLEEGEYQLDYYLIDRNSFLEDSVSVHTSKTFLIK
ncbi:hypothetical protein ACUNWD_11495 [Sunxiuqinia sp. A32]|uniref:hypothetical protein n=1 Tax=Sunxiuqinia sp. A32 TaxID=3461496 RepID=UPI0040453A19